MNAPNRALAHQHEAPLKNSRKDLLGLDAEPYPLRLATGFGTTVQWLTDLGFRIEQRRPDHWILTHSRPLPQLHFYSDDELDRFASARAPAYAKRILKETNHELSDLPG